jgi:hypothetical protein
LIFGSVLDPVGEALIGRILLGLKPQDNALATVHPDSAIGREKLDETISQHGHSKPPKKID